MSTVGLLSHTSLFAVTGNRIEMGMLLVFSVSQFPW